MLLPTHSPPPPPHCSCKGNPITVCRLDGYGYTKQYINGNNDNDKSTTAMPSTS